MKCEYGHDPVSDPGAMCQSCEEFMPNEYCEKHEWPAGMGKRCPDCAELERLTKERDGAERCAMEQLSFRLKAESQVRELELQIEDLKKKVTYHSEAGIEAEREKNEALRLIGEQQKLIEDWADMYGERTTLMLTLHATLEKITAVYKDCEPGCVGCWAKEALAHFDKETGKANAKEV